MPIPIKDGNNFEINRSIVYNGKDINFHMPSMSACIKHFEIGCRYDNIEIEYRKFDVKNKRKKSYFISVLEKTI